jgi:hypothetical protein
MFDKKNAAKVKQLLIMHFLLKEKLLEKWGIFRWTNKSKFIIKKGCLIEATFLIYK